MTEQGGAGLARLRSRKVPDDIPALYATRVRVPRGWLVEVASEGDPAVLAATVLPKGERVKIVDRSRGSLRIAVLDDGQLVAAMFVTRTGQTPSREWLIEQLCAGGAASSIELLAGRPAGRSARRS